MKKVYVFGAHSRARTTAVYLCSSDMGLSVAAFLTDNDEENAKEIDGIPVIDLRENTELDTSLTVYIGTRGVYFDDVIMRLKKLGFREILPVNVELDTRLRTDYFKRTFASEGREFRKIYDVKAASAGQDDKHTACIFEVRSIYDKALDIDTYEKQSYEHSIQVGTALTDVRLPECEFFDNTGENISEKNKQLCEITALYWIWKHAEEDLLGLVHYRRHFLLPDDWVSRMRVSGVDILLPTPIYFGPSIGENYRFRHVGADLDILLDILNDDADKCFSGNMFFPCNMFIMKREILDDYCSWLFPVLFELMERVGERDDAYQNRYPAFLAERLLNLYCFKNRNRLKTVFADKNFLR